MRWLAISSLVFIATMAVKHLVEGLEACTNGMSAYIMKYAFDMLERTCFKQHK